MSFLLTFKTRPPNFQLLAHFFTIGTSDTRHGANSSQSNPHTIPAPAVPRLTAIKTSIRIHPAMQCGMGVSRDVMHRHFVTNDAKELVCLALLGWLAMRSSVRCNIQYVSAVQTVYVNPYRKYMAVLLISLQQTENWL